MNYEKAIKILDLKNGFKKEELKKQYHIKAFKYHPDKNKTKSATKQFQDLTEAYHFLLDNEPIERKSSYSDFLNDFLKCINITDLSMQLFKDFDYKTLLEISDLLEKLNTNTEIMEKIKILLENKRENYIEINACIDDLLEDKIYTLIHKNRTYYVPLWHNELVYDISGGFDLVVKCRPILMNHIDIDEYNNINVNLSVKFNELINKQTVDFSLGNKFFKIPVEKLYIKKNQVFILKNCGILKIQEKNIYNENLRSDILVNIQFK